MSNYNCIYIKRHCSGASDVMSVVEQALMEPADADGEPAAASATAATERDLSRASSELRDVLARLHNLSYIVQSVDALAQATKDAENVYNTLLWHCPTDTLALEPPLSRKRKRTSKTMPSTKRVTGTHGDSHCIQVTCVRAFHA